MTDLGRTTGEIFNVGADNQIGISELAETIKHHLTGSDSPTVHIPFDEVYGSGIEDMLHRVPCTRKIRERIGWQPTRSLEQILADTIASTAPEAAIAA